MPVSARGAQVRVISGRIARAPGFHLGGRVSKESHFEGARHGARDLSLQLQNIAEIPVIGFRPEVKPGDGVNELRGDTYPMDRAAYAAFKHRPDIQLACDG